ncbi:uncharacterized protein At4g19900-like [Zingiber officinale]|uniref:Alpha 1,4-glycosyltransferase domain-containing protein n=1 Tax=Zingiber officinale TaxID=94328 RepID=A0A8J5GE83_ZINOF|nr:uncharacterized protein At4g19900-like [Zingiber officinale]KAG6505791.1 hypothetical protein ZIOFF_038156 [Zingiber officinale]
MLRQARRRPGYGPQLCAAAAALILLFLSLSVLYSRLSSSPSSSSGFSLRLGLPTGQTHSERDPSALFEDANLDDIDENTATDDDRIDELDVVEEEAGDSMPQQDPGSGLFWDHALGVARMQFGRPDRDGEAHRLLSFPKEHPYRGKIAFGSDDQPVDEDIRLKLDSIRKVEDALLLKVGSGDSPLRKGWSQWLEGKGDYLRRDRMLRSNLDLLNPKSHPLLQDPDGPGLTILTKGDRLVQRVLLKELENSPSRLGGGGGGAEAKRTEARQAMEAEEKKREVGALEGRKLVTMLKEGRVHADGQRWAYFPGLDAHLRFSDFMDQFLYSGKCRMRVFMVWNSPPWTYGIRHRRGLESLLHHHFDACVVVFSETVELDFFDDLVMEGYRVAVAMPNLDELLKDTPTRIFSSVWYQWRKTKHYPVHYSELIRLAALYKYGGIYLDSDIIVLNPIDSVKNFISIEDNLSGNPVFNGAVMAFEKNSSLMLECLNEFYSTYDDALLRWNGADLMTRVINRISDRSNKSPLQPGINVKPQFAIHPISSSDITRYFAEPVDEFEKAEQDNLFKRMMNESLTFHFWNALTSALVPEPNSLVERLLNQYCLHCLDVL